MADIKILDLTTATEITETTDYIPVVDTSDTTQDSTGTTKKATVRKLLGDRVLPDTIVGTTETQTLTNKTIDGDDNTLQDINPASIKGGLDGWIPAGETWTYASATTFTISGDKRGKYQVYDKIKLTQTTDKYFNIIAVSYSSPNTTVTVDGFGIYTLANATITSPYFSKMETPQGFPQREVVLFNGTASASVTLIETSAHFSKLLVYYTESERFFSSIMDLKVSSTLDVVISIQGELDGTYAVRIGHSSISVSGTSVVMPESGGNYSGDIKVSDTVDFSDMKFIPKITKVVGYRW